MAGLGLWQQRRRPSSSRVPGLDSSQSVPLRPGQGKDTLLWSLFMPPKNQSKRKGNARLSCGEGAGPLCACSLPTLSCSPKCLRQGLTRTKGASKVLVNGRKERKKAERQLFGGWSSFTLILVEGYEMCEFHMCYLTAFQKLPGLNF